MRVHCGRDGPHPISADWIAIADRGKGIQLVSTMPGTAARKVGTGEIVPISFTEDGKSLFVMALHDYPRAIRKLDLATNTETPFATISPEDKPTTLAVAIDATGETLAYSLIIQTSELYLVEPPHRKP